MLASGCGGVFFRLMARAPRAAGLPVAPHIQVQGAFL
jgi:hypothetical protein